MKKYTIFILILNYFFKKLIFFKKLLFYNFYFYYDLDFFKNINQLNKNYNFLNFFLFLKIFNLKQNSEDYNLYKYELMFRFPKFSIEISAKFLKYFNLNFSPKYTSFKILDLFEDHVYITEAILMKVLKKINKLRRMIHVISSIKNQPRSI